jgi:cell volume regulation protein A
MNTIHHTYWLLAGAALLILAGIASSVLARRFGAPLLLVFLGLGMLAGTDGPGGIAFDDVTTTYRIGSFALALILFDGGLRTHRESFRGVFAPTLLLATLGVFITAALTGAVAHFLLGLDRVHALLVGAVVASTDAAAVFFLLRAGGLQLRSRVNATLEIESSANDPVAVLLTTLLAEFLAKPHGVGGGEIALELAMQFGIGAVGGAIGGLAIATAMRKMPLSGGLAALFLIAAAIFVFGVVGSLDGSAFLAVYVAGVVAGNRNLPGFPRLLSVLDAMTWLCQIVMFLVLGLLVTPHTLRDSLLPALGIALFLMFVGRPVAVALCLAPFRYGKREIAFVAWVGLRGAVGIFLASIPLMMRLPHAALIFNVAFIVVLVSLLVQGWTIGVAARLFDVALPHRDLATQRVELDLPGSLEREMVGYPVAADAAVLRGAAVPAWAQLAMIVRNGQILVDATAQSLAVGDYAYLLAPPGRVHRLDWLFAPPDVARAAEREMFGEFTLDADVRLGEVAEFYGLVIRPRDAPLTLAEHFARRFEHTIEVGDRVRLGAVTLVARELDDDGVRKVGLKVDKLGTVLAKPRWLQRLLPRTQ